MLAREKKCERREKGRDRGKVAERIPMKGRKGREQKGKNISGKNVMMYEGV